MACSSDSVSVEKAPDLQRLLARSRARALAKAAAALQGKLAAERLTAHHTNPQEDRRRPWPEAQEPCGSEQDASGKPGVMPGGGGVASRRRAQCRRCGRHGSRRRSSSGAGEGWEHTHAGTAGDGLPHSAHTRRRGSSSTGEGSEQRSAVALAAAAEPHGTRTCQREDGSGRCTVSRASSTWSDMRHEEAALVDRSGLPDAQIRAPHAPSLAAWSASGGAEEQAIPAGRVCCGGARHGGGSQGALRMTHLQGLLSGLHVGMDALTPAWPPDALEWG